MDSEAREPQAAPSHSGPRSRNSLRCALGSCVSLHATVGDQPVEVLNSKQAACSEPDTWNTTRASPCVDRPDREPQSGRGFSRVDEVDLALVLYGHARRYSRAYHRG